METEIAIQVTTPGKGPSSWLAKTSLQVPFTLPPILGEVFINPFKFLMHLLALFEITKVGWLIVS